jgi:hypothetical protein
MVNQNSFDVLHVKEVIDTLPFVLHANAENPMYVFNKDYLENSEVIRCFKYFGMASIPEIKGIRNYLGYLTENVEGRGNFMRGVVFTNNAEDKIAIFHRSPNGIINDDYTLVLREKTKLLYRSGVVPGKGYRFNVENHLIIPGQKYTPFELNSPSIKKGIEQTPKNIRLAEILAGLNPNFSN